MATVVLAVTALAVTALTAGGCGEGGTADNGTSPRPGAGTSPGVGPTAGVGSAGRSSAARSPSGTISPSAVREAFFALPSRNIACALTTELARCDIGTKSWTPPPKPADCEFDYGMGVTVEGTAKGRLSCVSDSTLGFTDVLPYGRALRAGDFVCTSRETGVECRNTATGHGFTLAREAYTLF